MERTWESDPLGVEFLKIISKFASFATIGSCPAGYELMISVISSYVSVN